MTARSRGKYQSIWRKHRQRRTGKPARHRVGGQLQLERLEERTLLATSPLLAGIQVNDGSLLLANETRHEAPRDLTFKFSSGQEIDPTTLDGIRITRSGHDAVFGNGNDIEVTPGFVGLGSQPNQVIVRFAESLPDDRYRVEVLGAGASALENTMGQAFNNGVNFQVQFQLDLGAQVVAVVPQPVSRNAFTDQLEQARDQIVVYFNNDDLNPFDAEDPRFYQLIFTGETVTSEDDVAYLPTDIVYSAPLDRAILTFAAPLDELATGPGTFRLRIGTAESISAVPFRSIVTADPGSSFETATVLPALNSAGRLVSSSIDPQPYPVVFPGSNSDPGHREINIDFAKHVPDNGADAIDGITEFAYNFRDVYGLTSDGEDLINTITERQKQRAREIFDLYSYYLGVQFVETASEGFTVVTGDMRAINEDIIVAVGGTLGFAGEVPDFGPTAILDGLEVWDDDYGDSWFREAMRQIGQLLGLGDAYDLPEGTIMGGDPRLTFGLPPEPVFPGNHDIVHGQYLFRPDSIDIDLYRFNVPDAGLVTLETIAERLPDSSRLDTHLQLYRQRGQTRVLVAQNDDYFSEDSFLQVRLDAGTYYVGVTASGNDQYDPIREDSGAGGTTQGAYDLRLDFRPDEGAALTDVTGVELDGDNDGQAGGVHNFWFRAVAPENTIFVDKSAIGPGTGTLAAPFRTIPAALAASSAGDIVRIVGNGGADGNVNTRADNLAYEIGFNSLGTQLSDGRAMNVPQGVTAMVDAGAIFKMRRSIMTVGSSSSQIDRSDAALQILGTPNLNVVFTSADDESIGVDLNPLPTTPDPGDWGGIVFRNDIDQAEGRIVDENVGVFLNHVNHAEVRYGGGVVSINSIPQVIAPIHLTDARPTISFNTISASADAAMSANPDSFAETNFHSPEFQAALFTSDYGRIGPDIHGNLVTGNSVNGIFVRVSTNAGTGLEQMTVTGRWNDSDIVHVLGENVVLASTPGGPFRDVAGQHQARLDAHLTIEPGVVVKAEGARFEVSKSASFYAEGTGPAPIVLTSLRDDRFGAGGTFDTNNDVTAPVPGDWGGVFLGPLSTGSFDHAVIAYGGGVTKVEGSFAGFAAIEVHQAEARITRSVFEFNEDGFGGQGARERFGRGFNEPSVIFVRGSQPVIVQNAFRHNLAAPVSIDVNALNSRTVTDAGRVTGQIDRIAGFNDNQGPLVDGNVLTDNQFNGMVIRGGTVTTDVVMDDTDIAHVM